MAFPVRMGFTLGDYPRPGGDESKLWGSIVDQVRAAEEGGFDSVWVADHLMQTPVVAPADDPMLECYTLLGALAGITSRVRLGAFVGCAAYRNPALLAKAVTTLDVVSGGRAIFGIGSGWFEQEHHAYGYEYGTVAERNERLVETLEIVRSMFANESTSFTGKHFRVDGALNWPRPVQAGGPPVLVGGSGPKKTLRLVAEYADICNVTGGPDKIRSLMAVLDEHCAAVGRDPATICRTAVTIVSIRPTTEQAVAALPAPYRDAADPQRALAGVVVGPPESIAPQLRELVDAGLDGLVLSCPPQDRTGEQVSLIGELAREALF